jgi:hypothetical protein
MRDDPKELNKSVTNKWFGQKIGIIPSYSNYSYTAEHLAPMVLIIMVAIIQTHVPPK